ncbi:MAG: PSD1 and planctomycete cytochrome C domain-containing protein [Pirellulaceae bacterium]|nr:PSD1 and planctomycete cytochrome C domain-containing protein [Pirellulaceae bacterium]
MIPSNYKLLLASLILVGSNLAPCDAQELDFNRDIAPILEERCGYCHGEDEQESGLRLDLRANLLRGGDSGLATIVPGKPEKSYLIEVINHVDEEMAMPPDEDKLPAEEIELLSRCIKEGAVWPGQMAEALEKKSNHWSFQPIVRPPVPDLPLRRTSEALPESPQGVGNDSRQANMPQTHPSANPNPIDAFLIQSLAKQKLAFSQPADPRSLIRRTYIVLTGIAPTPEETASFLVAYAKDSESAYGSLVNRLLESQHFGERWAQHWLDVIRWAETNGSESNMYRKNAWIYRDYVIRAFNDDKPYNQFLFEQIAGDTVGQGDATGYLVAGPHVPIATVGQEPSARRQARADRMDEILQTVGASAMGMTIGCARCHNHKFDPISIRDYYSMSAAFQDVEFGSRFPELAKDHPRRLRGKQLYDRITELHHKLQKTGPWTEDWTGYKELHVPPTTTQKVRITFNWNGVRLDEIEIFGPVDRHRNLALASNGTQAFSPPEMAVVRAELHKVNDGQFGTEGWGAKAPKKSKQKPFIEFTFSQPHSFNRIRLSTNREDFLETDYLQNLNKFNFGGYRVEVQKANGKWQQIASTMNFEQLNKRHPSRPAMLTELQTLIQEVNEEGPKPSFVARFVTPVKTRVFNRGSPENPRDEVFAAGLRELDGDLDLQPNASGRQRRKAFAQWLTSPTQPLTARVAANRLWHHVFGQGIVSTTSDFGAAGAKPTHPELLDWLAAELMKPGAKFASSTKQNPQPWSVKHLLRLMLMSQAFRQSSQPHDKGLAVDAAATLLWRYPPKRVEAEVIRDSILQASGSLSRTVGGRSYRIHDVKKRYAQWAVTDNHGEATWRRMIYQERMRRVDDQMFTAFDFPDCGQVRDRRPVSTTPLQALNLMNSDFVMEQSKLISQRASKESDGDKRKSIDRCFQLLLGRLPSRGEQQACMVVAEEESLTLVCRALINSNEFAFLP